VDYLLLVYSVRFARSSFIMKFCKIRVALHSFNRAVYVIWPGVRLSVCPCLCLSVTSLSSTKTVKHRIMQTTRTIAQRQI